MLKLLPLVSFLIPTLNEERQIDRCLGSIRNQDYPVDKVEIVLADGGSKDATIDIAKRYGCKIVHNTKKLAEPGCYIAWCNSAGAIKFFIAADGELPHRNWLKLMVRPFVENPDMTAAFTQIIPAPKDNSLNRYYSLLHVEPFSWFVYREAANPRQFERIYNVSSRGKGYTVFDFSLENHPLEALCQGFGVVDTFQRKNEYEYDDVLPVLQMIEERRKIAYVPEAGIYHYHLKGLKDYWKKYGWRIRNSLYEDRVGYESRKKYTNLFRKLRKYLWILYGLSVLLPLFDSVRWYLRDKERAWFWHLPASFILCLEIIFEMSRYPVRRLKNAFLGR